MPKLNIDQDKWHGIGQAVMDGTALALKSINFKAQDFFLIMLGV